MLKDLFAVSSPLITYHITLAKVKAIIRTNGEDRLVPSSREPRPQPAPSKPQPQSAPSQPQP